jgi:hypothetical protein
MKKDPADAQSAATASASSAFGDKPARKPDSGSERNRKILAESRKRFETAQEHERENRNAAAANLRFLKGGDEQWDQGVLAQRKLFKLPVITINRMPVFVAQVVNDLRQNRPAIKVTPKDNQASHAKADIFSGLIRNIEYTSMADVAYDHAGEVAVSAGYYGYIRVLTRFSDDDGFEQDIVIRPIWNSFNVFMDPFSVEPDGSDRRWCHVIEDMSREVFEARYPDASGQWEGAGGGESQDWPLGDTVRVAEYWWREEEPATIVMLEDGTTLDKSEVDEHGLWGFAAKDQATGRPRVRKVRRPRIMTCKMTGAEILEGPTKWPGASIPIIPVEPKVMFDERGRKVLTGLISHSHGAQKYYNYDRSRRAELLALAPKAPFIGTRKQFDGLEELWKNANVEPYAFLPVNNDPEAPGFPQRMAPPALPPDGEGAQSIDDMKATMGIFDASIGNQSNEQSGKAIRARQSQADRSYFHFSDNQQRAIRCLGLVLLDLIPKVYDTERVVRVLGEDGAMDLVTINQQLGDLVLNDLSLGKYDVVVTSGPSYASQRLEESDALLDLIQAAPQVAGSIMDLVVEGMPFPNSDKIARRIRMGMPPQLTGQQPGGPPQPDPKTQAAQIELQGTQAKTQAEVAKAQLDVAAKRIQVLGQHHDLIHTINSNAAQMEQDALDQHAMQTAAARQMGAQQTADQQAALAGPGMPGLPGAGQ